MIVAFEPLRVLECREKETQIHCEDYYKESEGLSDKEKYTGIVIRGGSSLKYVGWNIWVGFVYGYWSESYIRGFMILIKFPTNSPPQVIKIIGPLPIEISSGEKKVVIPTSFIWATRDLDEAIISVYGGDTLETAQIYRFQGIDQIVRRELIHSKNRIESENTRTDIYHMWTIKILNLWRGYDVSKIRSKNNLDEHIRLLEKKCKRSPRKSEKNAKNKISTSSYRSDLFETFYRSPGMPISENVSSHVIITHCVKDFWNKDQYGLLQIFDKLLPYLPERPYFHFAWVGNAEYVRNSSHESRDSPRSPRRSLRNSRGKGYWRFPEIPQNLQGRVQNIAYITKECANDEYIRWAKEMQRTSPYVTQSKHHVTRTAPHVTGTTSNVTRTDSKGENPQEFVGWDGEMFWPKDYIKNHAKSLKNGRPLVLDWDSREVFWNYANLRNRDIVILRTKGQTLGMTLTLYYNLGAKIMLNKEAECEDYDLRKLSGPGMTPEEAKKQLSLRKYACFLASNSVLKRRFYHMDAVVRHVFWTLLSEALGEQCKGAGFIYPPHPAALDCPGHHLESSKCMAQAKFVIAMESQQEESYFTEKVFLALLAKTIPIHFGAPDIGKYINPKRIILCTVPNAKILELRKAHVRKKLEIRIPGNDSPHPMDAEVVRWASTKLRESLMPCVDRVKAVHMDDNAYIKILQEPVFNFSGSINDSWVYGLPAAMGLLKALKTLESPLLTS